MARPGVPGAAEAVVHRVRLQRCRPNVDDGAGGQLADQERCDVPSLVGEVGEVAADELSGGSGAFWYRLE